MEYKTLEILTEEASMDLFLRGLLPRILPEEYVLNENCFIRPHQGKSDLKKSIPTKIRAYSKYNHPVKVLIIHDQDSNDCVVLKNNLVSLIKNENTTIPFLVRIACRELENWYLGDPDAIGIVYDDVNSNNIKEKAKYRNPDRTSGAFELNSLSKNFSKTEAAREIGKIINFEENKSESFNQFVKGLYKLICL